VATSASGHRRQAPHPSSSLSMTSLNALTLDDLLPHRGRSLYVTEVLRVGALAAAVRCTVAPWWPFQVEGGVHPLILVELAAQAAGVCNGWDRIHTQGLDSNPMGWIVAVKKAEFFVSVLPLGESVIASSENTQNFGSLREVSCELRFNETLIGRVVLQLYQA